MPLFEGLCRSHLARLRIERGQWAEALRSLEAPIECTHYVRVRIALEWGLLRLREGRLDEAEAHFTRVGRLAESQLGLASIAWERGDAQTVKDLAERFLRALPAEDMLDRSLGLAWLARAHAALGDGVAACEAGSELTRIANTVGTPGLMADAHRVRGEVAAACGDHESARRHFEDAVDAAGRAGLPYQEAFAHLALAQSLRALGRDAAAAREATAAAEGYRSLGAELRAQRAEAFAAPCAARAPAGEPPMLPLSERELEVLRLVAQGLSNKEIAVKLYLSEHTVKRHVANILTRLELSSRAAAVAYAAKLGRL
jgi:ATP/maltotriose-dependent transcriptional regulator MalT